MVTLFGISIDVRYPQFANASSSILVTLLGIMTEVIPHPMNAPCPIVVILLGISIEVILVQPLQASFPMLVTLLPKETEVSFSQRKKA